ncbi:MAG: hypothetical protein HXS46_07655 [Theionarchaea archaeon]|nr:MAG: hypothetical protein AYK18_12335 [Theionarchaea archaeon DG-70]MBU7010551.1 hypothetical protein [Theionarchaea archaeon]
MDNNRIKNELMNILQEYMKKALPIPEGVRINFVFRLHEGFLKVEEICAEAEVSRETAESVLSKYVHYGVAKIHEDVDGQQYEYAGLSEDIKQFWRGNPVRVESLDNALQAGERYLDRLKGLDKKEAEQVALFQHVLRAMREEFLES